MPDDPFPYLRYTQKTHIPPTNPNIIKLVRPNIFSASHEYGFLGSVLHYQFTPHYFENLVYETNNSREDNCSKTDEHRSKCDFSRGVPDDPFFLLNTTRKQHTSPPPKKKINSKFMEDLYQHCFHRQETNIFYASIYAQNETTREKAIARSDGNMHD